MEMKLTDLEPQFLKIAEQGNFAHVDRLDDADGISLLCPQCVRTSAPDDGIHSIICWRPHVPAGIIPGPGRWEFTGTGYDDLSLVAAQSSIKLEGGCNAHFFIRNGRIEFD